MLFPKPTKTKRGNTIRKISKETKEYIIERDRVCIICEHEYIQTIHHCYFGEKSMYGPNRNDPEFCCGLCNLCHYRLHFEGNNDYREQAIEYLNNYYATNI